MRTPARLAGYSIPVEALRAICGAERSSAQGAPAVIRARHAPICTTLALAAFACAAPAPAQESTAAGQPPGATTESLATAVGEASRRDAIVAVGAALLCDPTSPALDSASVNACAAIPAADGARLVAAFAHALGRPLLDRWPTTTADYPACESESAGGPPRPEGMARMGAPVVGDYEGRWEGRITVELSCRQLTGGATESVRVVAREFLFQWDGRAWKMYQVGVRRVAG